MPLPFLSGGVRAVVEGSWDGQLTNNVLYFQLAGGDPTAVQVQTLAELLDTWYSTAVLPNLNEAFQYRSVTTQAINVGFGFLGIANAGSGTGGVDGESMSNNVNPCISFRTATAGRSFRGRNYIPGISVSDVDGNMIDTAWALALQAAYLGLTSAGAFDPEPFNWVVASFFLNGAPRGSAVGTIITNAIFTDLVVDSQRRRLPGRGR